MRFLAVAAIRCGSAFLTMLIFPMLFAAAADTADTRAEPGSQVAAALAEPLPTPASGKQNASVTVLEFFDYQCPICREIEPDLKKLVDQDSRVRLVHKDLPVFGDASIYAAYCSFAAARMGKYQAAHDALIGSRVRLESKDAVRAVLQGAGFDLKAIEADIQQHGEAYAAVLARNQREAKSLGIKGTPGVLVGNSLVLGSVNYARLERMIEAR